MFVRHESNNLKLKNMFVYSIFLKETNKNDSFANYNQYLRAFSHFLKNMGHTKLNQQKLL